MGGIVPLAGPTIIREPGGYLQAMRGPALEGVLMKVRVLVTAVVSFAVSCTFADEFGVFSSSLMPSISSPPQVGDSLTAPASFSVGASQTLSWNAGHPAIFHKPADTSLTAGSTSPANLSVSAYSLKSMEILSASELHWTASTPALAAPTKYQEATRVEQALPGPTSYFNLPNMQMTQPTLHHFRW
jgi:hypothetical protein